MEMINNIKDIALIFEGGGMRGSYTAGFLTNLLENEMYFDYVAGISAGSSHIVNYISRDTVRAKRTFTDIVLDPRFGGWRSFIKGEGYFRSQYLYEEIPYPNASLPLNFEAFMANPAELRIGAFRRDSGEIQYFTKESIKDITDLMKMVRSSSSMPIFMPPTFYDGHHYVDGGISGGIALDIAKKDGLKKYFVVLSREKGYRKKPLQFKRMLKMYYRKYPLVAEAMIKRHIAYNDTLDELEQLQSEGRVYLVYPDVMPVSSREMNYKKLCQSYQMGYEQGKRDVPKWIEFLGVG